MANIIGYITAALLAATAFLAIKNKGAIAEYSKESREGARDIIDQKRVLEEKRTVLVQHESESDVAAAEIATLKQEVEDAEASLSELDEKIAATEEAEAEKEKEVEKADEFIAKAEEVEFLLKDLKTQQRELAESQDKIATLEAKLASAEASRQAGVARVEAVARKNKGNTSSGLSTSIRNTVPSWGFVILNGGDTAGVVSGSTLQVVRSGEVIAKLLVRTVELGTASADIIPGTQKRGVTLRNGDRVVSSSPGKGA